jgi:Protein of unknown function (DUF3383)
MATIPASQIVSVNPGVLSPGGTPLALNGLILTQNASLPAGAPLAFASQADVAAYFGPTSDEANAAQTYFAGFVNATTLPTSLLFAKYALTATSGFIRGGSLPSLATLKLITAGSLSITLEGVTKTTAALDLSGAASYSAAAALIATALSLSGSDTCTYSSVFNAFTITAGNSTGTASTVTFGTGSSAGTLGFTPDAGAVLSQGQASVADANAFMNSLILFTQNWATFMTIWEPLIADKESFAQWTSSQNNRYIYACWDSSSAPTTSTDTTSIGHYCKANGLNGIACVYNNLLMAAFILGIGASTDFLRHNGRTDYCFRSGSGLTATVTDPTIASNLLANGYSFYGAYGTANDTFIWLYNGQVIGTFKWLDSMLNNIWMNNAFQLALMTLLNNMGSIPYNPSGYALIASALQDPINAALNFGAIRPNVPLSASQAAQVNANAGVTIDKTLGTRGWYLQISDPGAVARANRQSPSCTFWYMDGESVQQIVLASIDVL